MKTINQVKIIEGVEVVEKNLFFDIFLFVIYGILGFLIYFIPTIIAFKRRHVSKYGILVINLFFGFTFIGWIICFAWSVSKKD